VSIYFDVGGCVVAMMKEQPWQLLSDSDRDMFAVIMCRMYVVVTVGVVRDESSVGAGGIC
jgi:hypothetical protein